MSRFKSDAETAAATARGEFLKIAHDEFVASDEASKDNRASGKLALDFLNLKQWDEGVVKERNGATGHDKPSLTMDQIGDPYRQLIGRQRQADPSIEVVPGKGATKDTAGIFQGAIRNYAYTGHAKEARDEAFKSGAAIGWGYYGILIEDEMPGSFKQTVTYRAIENAFTVHDDPDAKGALKRDRRYLYITQDLPKAEFKRLYPDAKYTSAGDLFAASEKNTQPEWYTDGGARVAERWYLDEVTDGQVALLSDGRECPIEQAQAIVAASQQAARPAPGAVLNLQQAPAAIEIVRTKDVKKPVVKWAKISGAEILEGNAGTDVEKNTEGRVWPGTIIPFIRVIGERLVNDGTEHLWGLPKPMIDPQRLYNFTISEFAHELASGPHTKIIAPEGANEGHEEAWANPDRRTLTALFYHPTFVEGSQVPAPSPEMAQFTDSAKLMALLQAINQYKSDLKSASGYYDASDPSRQNAEQSAKAILARKEESQQSSANYVDNYQSALLFEGEILIDLIPKIVVKGQLLRILDMEGNADSAIVGVPFKQGEDGSPIELQPGEQFDKALHTFFDPAVGKFDVAVTVGSSYPTRRKEAVDTWMQIAQAWPAFLAVAGDLIVGEMDAPGADAIAERLKKALPPALQADDSNSQIPPQVVAQVKQMQQQAGQVIEHLTQIVQKLEADAAAKKQDNDAKVAMNKEDNATKLRIAEMTAKQADAEARAEAMAQRLEGLIAQHQQLMDQAHEVGTQAADQAHERDMAAQQHQQALQQGQQGVAGQLAVGQQAADNAPAPEAGA